VKRKRRTVPFRRKKKAGNAPVEKVNKRQKKITAGACRVGKDQGKGGRESGGGERNPLSKGLKGKGEKEGSRPP